MSRRLPQKQTEVNNLSAAEHFQELRKRCIIVVLVFACCVTVCFVNLTAVMNWLLSLADSAGFALTYLSPQEAVIQKLRVGVVMAAFLSLPFLLYELLLFVSPAVSDGGVPRGGIILLAGGTLMFAMGVIFAVKFAFPMILSFLFDFSSQDVAIAQVSVEKYVSLFLTVTICLGVIFEIPVIVGVLTRVGILSIEKLRSHNVRSAYFIGTTVFAAVVTPPDPVTIFAIAVPMWILYPVSILIGVLIERRKCNVSRAG